MTVTTLRPGNRFDYHGSTVTVERVYRVRRGVHAGRTFVVLVDEIGELRESMDKVLAYLNR